MSSRLALTLSLSSAVLACSSPPPPAPAKPPPTPPPPAYDQVDRQAFNRIAAAQFLPVFWVEDKNGDHKVDPAEIAVLYGLKPSQRSEWVNGNAFTPAFDQAYLSIARSSTAAAAGLSPEEQRRRAAIVKELSQGRPTIVASDFSGASEEDRAVVTHVLKAMKLVEDLHMKQKGTFGLDAKIPADRAAELCSTEGKDWILSKRNLTTAVAATTYGWHQPNGKPIQGLGPDEKPPAHDHAHFDQTQVLRPIRRIARRKSDGADVDLCDELESRGLPAACLKALRD